VETVAMMTMIANEVQKISKLPLGINVLRNDGESALAIALAAGADFIRVNILTGARVTDQGVIQGNAFDLLRMRKRLEAQHIAVLADVDVKHSVALASRALKDEVEDTLKRGLADGLIVSGAGTGKKTDPKKVQEVAEIAKGSPVFLGSGIDVDNVSEYGNAAKGFIVGTHFKKNSAVAEPVELSRVQAFMKMLNNL
jgi:membrane complex biogenesis BtpA family protein